MLKVYPDYYKEFKCVGGSCSHNCCIGWEIDIDEDTLEKYRCVKGAMSERLSCSIAWDDEVPHFINGKDKRCPFLNENNLCDIILTMGEDDLSVICSEHPRFTSELPGRIEVGLGLCCEEACRMILGKKEPVSFVCEGNEAEADEIVSLRDKVIILLQDRSLGIDDRVENMLREADAVLPERSFEEWARFFLSLERLDEKWTDVLSLVRDNADEADVEEFKLYMKDRESEYEQLLVYFIYRHMACASDLFDAAARAAFAALAYKLIFIAGACIRKARGSFTFADQAELARLFSSEVEYSEENLNTVFDELF